MTRPDVELKEVDLSLIIRGDANTKAAIVFEANEGTLEPQLISNNKEFIEKYGQPDPALLGHYCAFGYLEKGIGLIAKRVVGTGALYGGAVFTNDGLTPYSLTTGVATPESYTFGADDLFLVTPIGPGAYGNANIAVTLKNAALDGGVYVFDLEISKKNSEGNYEVVETYTVSRDPSKKDGFGNSMYIIDVINRQSQLVYVVDNELQAATVEPVSEDDVAMGAGVDGAAATAGEISAAWETLKEPEDWDYYLLINNGYTDATVQAKIVTIAEYRRGFGILDTPYGLTPAETKTFREGQNVDSNYVGFYYQWQKIYDQQNDKYVWVAPSGAVSGVHAYTISRNEFQKPAAGKRRGKVNCIELERVLSDAEQDLLYNAQINYLTYKKGSTYVWGSKTAQTTLTHLSYSEVRHVLNYIENTIMPSLDDFLFEINDAFTRLQVYTAINDFVQQVKVEGKVYDVKVVCDESNNPATVRDNRELRVDVYVKPAPSIQWVRLQTIITKSSANFEELIVTGGNF